MSNKFELIVEQVLDEGIGTTAASIALGAALATSGPAKTTLGGRLNNPANIRYSKTNKWEGAIGSNGEFVKFASSEWGVRALIKIMQTYHTKYHLNTVKGIITTYAPPKENNTSAYIAFVCNRMGVKPNDKLNLNDANVLFKLVSSIIKKETSWECPQEVFYKAYMLVNQTYKK